MSRCLIVIVAIAAAACSGGSLVSLPASPSAGEVRIAGQVLDTLRRPLGGAQVEIVDGPLSGIATMTNDDGRFALGPWMSGTDRVTIRIVKDGYTSATEGWRGRDVRVTLTAIALVDLGGASTVTFTAAAECTQLPAAVRTRTYSATGQPTTRPGHFTLELGAANFYPAYDTFSGVAASDAVRFPVYSWQAFIWWLEDQPIFERLAGGTYIALSGTATAPVVQSNASIGATFDGSFSYCSDAHDPTVANIPPACAAAVECRSDHHQLLLSRR